MAANLVVSVVWDKVDVAIEVGLDVVVEIVVKLAVVIEIVVGLEDVDVQLLELLLVFVVETTTKSVDFGAKVEEVVVIVALLFSSKAIVVVVVVDNRTLFWKYIVLPSELFLKDPIMPQLCHPRAPRLEKVPCSKTHTANLVPSV